MKNKSKVTFLTTILATSLLLAACGGSNPSGSSSAGGQDSSSLPQSSSTIPVVKHTVNFVVDGETVQTSEVVDGEVAEYTAARPEKAPVSETQRYKFTGWDKNIKQAITEDTTFTAQFQLATYTPEVMIDDFESYSSDGDIGEAGWVIKAYVSDKWDDTSASMTVGYYSQEGQKSLRVDAWENNIGFRISKAIPAGTYSQNVNALRFRLKIPKINTVRAIVEASIPGLNYRPRFLYEFKPTSNDYVEYTVPLSSANLKDSSGKSLKQMATDFGLHEDDLLKVLSSVDFYFQGDDKVYEGNGWPFIAFLDSVKFVTVSRLEEAQDENRTLYNTYSGNYLDGKPVRMDFADGGIVTMKHLAQSGQPVESGEYSNVGSNVSIAFTNTGTAQLYTGTLFDSGKTMRVNYRGDDFILTAVQPVDNYDQYETDGVAYYASSPAENRSGCRGAYYSEYYKGSGSSPWAGNGWSLMEGKGDQLKLVQGDGAHSGNQYLSIKHSKTVAMRYMQWGLFDGSSVNKDGFRGSKLSFWAKSDGLVNNFKVSMYSNPAPTHQNKDQRVKVKEFTETQAISEWKQYEIDLNPNLSYYGFMIFTEKNGQLGQNQAYLFIDDVEVYDVNPYYVPAL